MTASGYPAPTFSATGLPGTVTLDTNTGVLAAPLATGSYPITITATNGVAPDATQNFTLNVITQSIGTPSGIGNNGLGSATQASSLTISVTQAVPVGNTVIVAFVDYPDACTPANFMATDTSGNTYIIDASAGNTSANACTIVFSAPVTTALTVSPFQSTITINFPDSLAYANASAIQVGGLVRRILAC